MGLLSVKALFSGKVLSHGVVYHHYNKWSKSGKWKSMWFSLHDRYRNGLDISCVDLDGSHTAALRNGEGVGYQGRKKRKTTNALYLTDRQGLPLAMSSPKSGERHNVHDIENVIGDMFEDLKKSHIRVDGLFLNTDAEYDCDLLQSILCEKGGASQTSASINGEKMPMTSMSMMSCMLKGIPLNKPTLGWTVSGCY